MINAKGASPRLQLAVSLLLIATILLAPLPVMAAIKPAKGQTAKSRAQDSHLKSSVPTTEVDSFIIQEVDGVGTCRAAQADEVRKTLRRADDPGIPAELLLPRQFAPQIVGQAPGGLTINFNVLSQLQTDPNNATIVAAFQRAAAVWTARIKSPVTISINIDYGPNFPGGPAFESGVIGATSSRRTLIDYQGARTNLLAGSSSAAETAIYNQLPTSVIPTNTGNGAVVSANRSQAFALGFPVTSPGDENVATMGFNKNFAFDFNPDDGINGGQTDFVGVAIHEIGHALGFVSRAGGGATTEVSIWDIFRFRPNVPPGSLTNGTRIMTIGGGEQVYFTGQSFTFAGSPTTELGLSTGGPEGVTTGGGDGNQSSHWKDDFGLFNNYIGIMDPTIPRGVVRDTRENDFLTLETLGWNLVSSVAPPAAPPAPSAPANDKFAGAQVIAGCTGSAIGLNVGATRETGEPIHSPDDVQGNRSVWYVWQAPGSGSVTFTTLGSGFDTVLGVYSGTSVSSLTTLGRHDDVGGPNDDKTSSVTFTAIAGNIYRIAVDGYNNGGSGGDFGSVKLNWTAPGCSPNPIDDAAFFVRQHYLDFLNRDPDAAGLAFWINEITSCGANAACIEVKRINVSAAFFLSIEFQQTGYFVERIYKTAYGNASGTSTIGGVHQFPVPIVRFDEFSGDKQQIGDGVVVGQAGWEQLLETRKGIFASDFVQRTRFTNAFPGSMTAAAFVDTLNANAGNPLSATERNALVNDLQSSAKTRAQVLRAVAEDSDLVNSETNRAFVLAQFFGYMRRDPNGAPDADHTGYEFWLSKLNQFNGNFVEAEMVKAFLVSGEYRGRFND
jgi:hypothetical protein